MKVDCLFGLGFWFFVMLIAHPLIHWDYKNGDNFDSIIFIKGFSKGKCSYLLICPV